MVHLALAACNRRYSLYWSRYEMASLQATKILSDSDD
jgi:hypothetical protein